MNEVISWLLFYRGAILISIIPAMLVIHDLWILLFAATGGKKREQEKTAAQSPEIQTAASPKS